MILSEAVAKLAQAIAEAEGFGPPDNFPTRVNNPGDLELGDKGWGTQSGKTVFKDVQDGWAALYFECNLMLAGKSHVYSLGNTISEVAVKYTGNDNAAAWATIVSGALGISPDTTLATYVNS